MSFEGRRGQRIQLIYQRTKCCRPLCTPCPYGLSSPSSGKSGRFSAQRTPSRPSGSFHPAIDVKRHDGAWPLKTKAFLVARRSMAPFTEPSIFHHHAAHRRRDQNPFPIFQGNFQHHVAHSRLWTAGFVDESLPLDRLHVTLLPLGLSCHHVRTGGCMHGSLAKPHM